MPKISVQVRGVDAVIAKIKKVPGGIKPFLAAVALYLLGDESHGLRHADPYKYVTRKKAYGVTFFTDKQRKWFFANGGASMIGNHRTGASSRAWTATATNGGYGYKLSNSTTAAYYTRSDSGQARQPALVGWRKVSVVIKNNTAGAIRAGMAAYRKFIG